MSWPPQVGDLLQRRTEPLGIEDKLRTYSLVHDHEVGGPKANGFLIMLGIDLESIDYLIAEIEEGITHTPISKVEPKKAGAMGCTVKFRIAGVGRYSHRWSWLRTGWNLDGPEARPRLSTAYLRGRERR
jgi:hypothetical protein